MNIWLAGIALIASLHSVAAQESAPAWCMAVNADAMLVDTFSEPASIYYDFNTLYDELSAATDEAVTACAHSLASAILMSVDSGGDLEGIDALEVTLYSLTSSEEYSEDGEPPLKQQFHASFQRREGGWAEGNFVAALDRQVWGLIK